MNWYEQRVRDLETVALFKKAEELAKSKGYTSLFSMPVEKRQQFVDEAKKQLEK